MGKKFLAAKRVSNILYWKCPNRGCFQHHTLIVNSPIPHTFHCNCGTIHIVTQITELFSHSARLLVEIKGDDTNIEEEDTNEGRS